jgi:hypothetical protein
MLAAHLVRYEPGDLDGLGVESEATAHGARVGAFNAQKPDRVFPLGPVSGKRRRLAVRRHGNQALSTLSSESYF